MPYQIEEIPDIKPEDWRLKITGLVDAPQELSLAQLKKMPCELLEAEVVCLKGKMISGSWSGVSLKNLAEIVKPQPGAKYVTAKAASGYAEPLEIADALSKGVIVAYNFGKEPVAPEHGGALRLIASQKYAYKSVKWVTELEFSSAYQKGYWEKKGYPDNWDAIASANSHVPAEPPRS